MAAKPSCDENNDEDLKVIDVSPIKSLFFAILILIMMGLNMIHLYLEDVLRIRNFLILMLKLIKVGLKKLKP